MTTELNPSPSRTYIIPVFSIDFKHRSFVKFYLPEKYDNTCGDATWYFYNVLDSVACGDSAYPFEMHNDIAIIPPPPKYKACDGELIYSHGDENSSMDNPIEIFKCNKCGSERANPQFNWGKIRICYASIEIKDSIV